MQTLFMVTLISMGKVQNTLDLGYGHNMEGWMDPSHGVDWWNLNWIVRSLVLVPRWTKEASFVKPTVLLDQQTADAHLTYTYAPYSVTDSKGVKKNYSDFYIRHLCRLSIYPSKFTETYLIIHSYAFTYIWFTL